MCVYACFLLCVYVMVIKHMVNAERHMVWTNPAVQRAEMSDHTDEMKQKNQLLKQPACRYRLCPFHLLPSSLTACQLSITSEIEILAGSCPLQKDLFRDIKTLPVSLVRDMKQWVVSRVGACSVAVHYLSVFPCHMWRAQRSSLQVPDV